MSHSRKSRRSQRHQNIRTRAVQLNLVSMIDVFAVLVFFLLVSSSLSAARLNVIALNLPSPDVSIKPDPEPQRLTVTVSKSGIEVTGRNGASRRLANTPDGYNYLALSELLVQEKKSAPSKKDITLLLDADVIYDNVVQLMDTARLTPAEARAAGLPAELFPQITIGDAPGVTLASGRLAKRAGRAARLAESEELNIVSLIDIFAILVFYLLVNALVVEVLPNPKALVLPQSEIKEQPRETVLILVTADDILVGSRKIMTTAQALGTVGNVLPALKSELLLTPLMPVDGGAPGALTRGEVNIMADKSIPYHLLKKVMATTTDTRFAKISLAVVQKKTGASE